LVTYATGGLVPDLTVLLDVDVEEGLRRKKKDNEWNRLDAYTVDFHQRVRAGYAEMVQQEPDRWVVVNAGQEWESVQEELRIVIQGRLKTK
jgi:dTMP kinase